MNTFKSWMEARRIDSEKERHWQWKRQFQGDPFLSLGERLGPEFTEKRRQLKQQIGQQYIQGLVTFDQAREEYKRQINALRSQYENTPPTPQQAQPPPQPSAAPRVFRFARPQSNTNVAPSVDKKALAAQIRQFVPQDQLGMTVEMLLRQLES
jgi:hypothetical protein